MFRTTDCSQRRISLTFAVCFLFLLCATRIDAQVLGDPVDVSQDFQKMENVYFVGSKVMDFNPATGQGTLQWNRYVRSTTLSFNKMDVTFRARSKQRSFPAPNTIRIRPCLFRLPSSVPRTIRLRLITRAVPLSDGSSLMLAGPVAKDNSWKVEQTDQAISLHKRVWAGAHYQATLAH